MQAKAFLDAIARQQQQTLATQLALLITAQRGETDTIRRLLQQLSP